jgi:hypothetical protein
VLQQITGSPAPVVIEHGKTPNGTFAVALRGGPSRVIEVAYRAFSTDAPDSAEVKIEESVGAGVQLSVTPRHTGSEGTITLNGLALGPVPSQGVAVELLVHYRGRWEPFRSRAPPTSPKFGSRICTLRMMA